MNHPQSSWIHPIFLCVFLISANLGLQLTTVANCMLRSIDQHNSQYYLQASQPSILWAKIPNKLNPPPWSEYHIKNLIIAIDSCIYPLKLNKKLKIIICRWPPSWSFFGTFRSRSSFPFLFPTCRWFIFPASWCFMLCAWNLQPIPGC